VKDRVKKRAEEVRHDEDGVAPFIGLVSGVPASFVLWVLLVAAVLAAYKLTPLWVAADNRDADAELLHIVDHASAMHCVPQSHQLALLGIASGPEPARTVLEPHALPSLHSFAGASRSCAMSAVHCQES
jgi:hypothetical protein